MSKLLTLYLEAKELNRTASHMQQIYVRVIRTVGWMDDGRVGHLCDVHSHQHMIFFINSPHNQPAANKHNKDLFIRSSTKPSGSGCSARIANVKKVIVARARKKRAYAGKRNMHYLDMRTKHTRQDSTNKNNKYVLLEM